MLVLRRGENHCTRRKTCRSKGENQQQMQCSSSFNGDDDDDDDDDDGDDDKNSCSNKLYDESESLLRILI